MAPRAPPEEWTEYALIPGRLRIDFGEASADRARCFQLMRTANPALLRVWTARWVDLVDFEVVPGVTSAEAAALSASAPSTSEDPG